MDPNATWANLQEAVAEARWDRAAEIAEDLLDWLAKDGFPPNISGKTVFDKILARATCQAIATWSCV